MAVSVTVTEVVGGGGWRLSSESGIYKYHRRLRGNPPNMPLLLHNPIPMPIRCFNASTTRSSFVVARARDESSTTSPSASQEDLWYVAKLAVGSFVGAAAIKYGSALFPEITRPNLVLALFLILTPVLVAVFLLINQSRLNP